MTEPVKDYVFVLLQFLIFIAWIFEPDSFSLILPENLRYLALFVAGIGLLLVLIAFLQLNTNLSPFPTPKKGAKLLTTGIFEFSRHPIYSGILFMAFGISFWLNSGYKLLISLLLFLLFYLKSRYEEERLQKSFPEYVSYKRQTGRFFPKFRWRI